MAITKTEMVEFEVERTTRYGNDVLTAMADAVQRQLNEITRYQQKYANCEDVAERAQVLSYVVASVASLQSNLRVDLAMKAHADLCVVKMMQKTMETGQ